MFGLNCDRWLEVRANRASVGSYFQVLPSSSRSQLDRVERVEFRTSEVSHCQLSTSVTA